MAEPPITFPLEESEPKLWRTIVTPFAKSFKNECNMQSYELGIECCLGTYLITAFGLKRPQVAFKYSMIAFFTVPMISWPLCVVRKKSALEPKEL